MKKITPAILALFLCAWGHLAFAQMASFFPGPGTPATSGGGGYTGPCDAAIGATCIAYYAAFGCATSAYSGNVVDVVDTATGNTTGTRLQCSGGTVSALVSASACTFVTGNACSLLATTCATSCVPWTIYNQLGTGTLPNLTNPANGNGGLVANAPTLSLTALNSKPCFNSAAGGQGVSAIVTGTVAQPFTLAAVTERTGNFTSLGRVIASNSGGVNISFRNSSNLMGVSGGSAVTNPETDGVFHDFVGVINGASTTPVVDGVGGTPAAGGASGITSSMQLMTDSLTGVGGSGMTGFECEALVYSSALNSTQWSAYHSNTRASNRWGASF